MGENSPNSFHAVVKGRVQGVGFRVFTRESASRHQIKGWVRNLPNGEVEVQAEGDEVALTEFLTDLYRGPVLSHVADIELNWEHKEELASSFDIVR